MTGYRSTAVIALFAFVIVLPRQLHIRLGLTLYARSLFVGRQKYEDEVKPDAILRDVIGGCSYHPPRTRYKPDSRPSCRQSLVRPFACLYTLLPTNELYPFSRSLALLVVNGRSQLSS